MGIKIREYIAKSSEVAYSGQIIPNLVMIMDWRGLNLH